MKYIVAFLRFWFDFIVGDDWRVAAGVTAGLALTAVLTSLGMPAWWLMPLTVVLALARSVLRTARRSPMRGSSATG